MIDIGANLTNRAFASDLDAVLDRAWASGVDCIVVTGTDVDSSARAIDLCARDATRLFCTVGVHPHDSAAVGADWVDALERLSRHPCVRAIGECGLDFNRNYSPHDVQRRVFDAQLALAGRRGLPVFVHDRDAGTDVGAQLAIHRPSLRDAVVHCFTGDAPTLQRYLELDCHIGVTGWICDERRGQQLAALAPRIPDDRLLIETDAPFLLPRTIAPRPTGRRNEPAHLGWVARRLAEVRGQTVEHVAAVTAANARRVFALGPISAPDRERRLH
jgi:TatD DNase family protein